jgi:hypothetical protein
VRVRERDGGRKRNEEMKSEWEGDATLTIVSTSNFIQLLDEIIFYLIMNKKDINMMSAWNSFLRKRCIFNEDDIQKLDEFLFVKKYHAFWT